MTAPKGPSWQGKMSAPTRLVLLRHGQTPLSVDRRYSGLGDPELTEIGRAQAQAAAERLGSKPAAFGDITAVLASPLSRARATAGHAADALGLDVEVDDDLIETDFGQWEGMTFAEAAAHDPELHRRWLGDPDVPPPGGESFNTVQRRIEKFRADVVDRFGGATLLCVSHVSPIKALLRDALGGGHEVLFRTHLDLASFCVVEFYPDGGSVVRLVNDTAHLS